jgi:hypothetical protein
MIYCEHYLCGTLLADELCLRSTEIQSQETANAAQGAAPHPTGTHNAPRLGASSLDGQVSRSTPAALQFHSATSRTPADTRGSARLTGPPQNQFLASAAACPLPQTHAKLTALKSEP